MKYEMELNLRTEIDAYAKQYFRIHVGSDESMDIVREELICNIKLLDPEMITLNKHTLRCVFGDVF